ncbi:hypothetical protein HOS13_gp19 [Caulobacter phage Lullwater]|uniref:Uncharacterized protein n=1 Tax=Caulobacter phage Lullwater TaxID=2024607 RepID=A0A291LB86_9CAUD|nr:hypothetical protein HOS13_gp19 [Caulobacter phage Lullwater]ATI16326.1 hypothetical protein Lull_019 [Caulobacter phage Lullwater]
MALDNEAIKNLAQGVALPNQTETTKGGDFERELPVEGITRLRLIEYIELGKQKKVFNGEEKYVDQVSIGFELSGPKHPPMSNGEPFVIRWRDTYSMSDRAKYPKLFAKLNYEGTKTHAAQMLGDAFAGRVYHFQKKDAEGKVIATYANLHNKEDGFSFKGPFRVIEGEDGSEERVKIEVEPVRSKLRLFIFEHATKEMWDSLFIDGHYEDKVVDGVTQPGASKNYWQNLIRGAKNWNSCPIAGEVDAGGSTGITDAEKPSRSGASADPLEDM